MAKGQVFTAEILLISIGIIIMVLVFLFSFSAVDDLRKQSNRDLSLSGDAASSLLLTKGTPHDWDQNVSNTVSLGIVSRRNVIDVAKLNALNLTDFKEILGLGRFNVSITIQKNKSTIYQTGEINGSEKVVLIERTCVLNGAPCKLRLEVSSG